MGTPMGTGTGVPETLTDTDIYLTGQALGDTIYFDGAKWVASSPTAGSGDMLKATYDTDADSTVDKAASINDGTYSASAADIKDATTKKHTQGTDTDLDATFEATFSKVADIDDTPVNGVVNAPISSNWAYDHSVATTGIHGAGTSTIAKLSDITATKIDDLTAGDDNTDLNASTAKHGLFPKLPAASGKFLKDDMTWDSPAGGAHTQNTDTILLKSAGTTLIDGGTLKVNLAVDGSITVDGVDISAHTAAVTGIHGAGTGTIATLANIAATKLDDLTAPDDNTDLNASTAKHGLVIKAVAPAASILNVVGIANGETIWAAKSIFDGTAPTTQAFGDSAVAGTSLLASHRDHKHGMPSGSAGYPYLIVATSDASATQKTAATDSGGGVLTGTNDQIALATYITAAVGGILRIVGHTVSLTSLTISNCTVIGDGGIGPWDDQHGTLITTTGGITIGVNGRLQDCWVLTSGAWSGKVGITIGGAGVQISNVQEMLKNVSVHNETDTDGIGVLIQAVSSGTASYVEWCSFSHVFIMDFDIPMKLLSDDSNNLTSWVNQNSFYDISLMNFTTAALLLNSVANHAPDLSGNSFFGVGIQPVSPRSVDGIKFDGVGGLCYRMLNNNFYGLMFWDWGSASGLMINMDCGEGNAFYGASIDPDLCSMSDDTDCFNNYVHTSWTGNGNVSITRLTRTISSGAVTLPCCQKTTQLLVEGEGAAADALSWISGGGDGDILILGCYSAAHAITVHNTDGNIKCGADVVLDNVYHTLTLVHMGQYWVMIGSALNT
jgi:hypothetical protein